jgi:zinc protease
VDFETAKPGEAETAVLAEIENIKRYGVTKEQLARAKALIAQDYYHGVETVDGVAQNLAYYEALGDWKQSRDYIPAIQNVSVNGIASVAKKYLTFQNLSVFEYLSESTARNWSLEDLRTEVIDKVPGAMQERSIQELSVDAEVPAGGNDILQDLVKPVTKRSILRGPDVYIVEDHRLPLVSFGIFYPGGRLYESAKDAGITELMLRSAIRGTQRFNSQDISRRLENAGARIEVVNEPDFFGYIVDGLSAKMNEALQILVDVLQQPAFLDDEIEKEKVLQIARIKKLRENNYRYPVSLFMRTLFGDHPYAWPAAGSEASVKAITKKDLEDWFKTNERQLLPTIVIAGDSNGTGLIAPIADKLTNVDLHERDIASLPRPALKLETQETVETATRQQTALVYGFPGPPQSSQDRYPLLVLENVVSGLGGRFFDAIREQQGLAYTVRTENLFFSKAGAIYTYAAFSPENEDRVEESLRKEIDRLRKDGVTPDELKRSIAYTVGEHQIGLQTRLSLVFEYARSIYGGQTVQDVGNYDRFVGEVTAEQVRAAAEKYLDPKQLRVAILRGKTN